MPDIWIQLENRPWDTMPNNIDRMTGRNAHTITGKPSELVTITSPNAAGTGIRVTHTRRMYAPLRDSAGKVMDALIFRRYKAPDPAAGIAEWQVPDDRKVNPWDINEKDPTDSGTMGTIPGPPIECNVGEEIILHFRNLDMRSTKPAKARAHSLHVHGFVFKQEHDGAYPLSGPDSTQRVDGTTPLPGQVAGPNETALWNLVAPGSTTNFGTLKKGDRVPPGGTFVYHWTTQGWPSTSGVWLYHDHSFCDDMNMGLGAIGMVIIHNPSDTENDFTVSNEDFPAGSSVGNPIDVNCFPFATPFAVDSSILDKVGIVDPHLFDLINPGGPHEMRMGGMPNDDMNKKHVKTFAPDIQRVVQQDNLLLHLNTDLTAIKAICSSSYKAPPTRAIYLQLFHKLTSSPGMNINGRTYLGNTPSVVAGTNTLMRFGLVGMGQSGDVHTFHIHGHRWTVNGADGNSPGAIQGSPQVKAVSQFEDTRIFGPASSFGFTINGAVGSFMRAGGKSPADSKGEWHMHCHFLDHMMSGMMGSLLIVDAGQSVILPRGELCPSDDIAPAVVHIVNIVTSSPGFPDGSFGTASLAPVKMGDTVRFNNIDDISHGVQWLTPGAPANSSVISAGGTWDVVMPTSGTFNYQCLLHGASMPGSITVTM